MQKQPPGLWHFQGLPWDSINNMLNIYMIFNWLLIQLKMSCNFLPLFQIHMIGNLKFVLDCLLIWGILDLGKNIFVTCYKAIFLLSQQFIPHFGLFHWNYIPYRLAYKSRNFGQFVANIFSFRLIRGSQILWSKLIVFCFISTVKPQWYILSTNKIFKFWTVFATFFPIRLIRGSTYTRVYTVL